MNWSRPTGTACSIGGRAGVHSGHAAQIGISRDYTISADGQPLAQLGLGARRIPSELRRATGVLHEVTGTTRPVDEPVILQGFLEESNVNPSEMARLIEVQRAYEAGQKFMDRAG